MTTPDGMASLSDLAEMRKDVEKVTGSRIYFGSDERLKLRKLPIGIAPIDHVLAGGFGFDRMSIIIGEFSAGKTLLAQFAMKSAQEKGLSVGYIDGEKTWTPEWSTQLGVDPNKVIVVRPRSGEDAFNVALALIRRKVGLLVIDSLASLRPKTETEGEEDEVFNRTQVGAHARLINKGIEDLESENQGTCIIAINQLRSGIGGYGNPETMPGGKAQGFYAWQLIRVRRIKFIEEKEKRIGYVMRIKVEKSKQSEPFREVDLQYYFTGDIDELMGTIEMAIELGVIRRDGTYYFVDEVDKETGVISEHKFWGRPKLIDALRLDERLMAIVSRAVDGLPTIDI